MSETGEEEGTLSLDDKVSKCDITCAPRPKAAAQVALVLLQELVLNLKLNISLHSNCDIACAPRPKPGQVGVPSFSSKLKGLAHSLRLRVVFYPH